MSRLRIELQTVNSQSAFDNHSATVGSRLITIIHFLIHIHHKKANDITVGIFKTCPRSCSIPIIR